MMDEALYFGGSTAFDWFSQPLTIESEFDLENERCWRQEGQHLEPYWVLPWCLLATAKMT